MTDEGEEEEEPAKRDMEEQRVPESVSPSAKTLKSQREADREEKPQHPYKPPDKKQSESAQQHQGSTRKMTHARKQNLKSLMLNKARQDLKVEAEHKAEEKKRILNSRIEPLEDLSGMNESELKELCRDLQAKIDKVDEERYDIEVKVKKNDLEIEDLNQRIFDLRGKFKRPPLRRVRMSADQMLRALLGSKHKVSMDLRSSLKSVKKDEGKKEEAKDWRENIEAKQGMSGMKAVFEAAQEETQ